MSTAHDRLHGWLRKANRAEESVVEEKSEEKSALDRVGEWLEKASKRKKKRKKKLKKDTPNSIATGGVSSSTVNPAAASTISNFFRKK